MNLDKKSSLNYPSHPAPRGGKKVRPWDKDLAVGERRIQALKRRRSERPILYLTLAILAFVVLGMTLLWRETIPLEIQWASDRDTDRNQEPVSSERLAESSRGAGEKATSNTSDRSAEDSVESARETQKTTKVPVYISGAVQNPGVYYLDTDSLINDLVFLAGGFSESPHSERVNLAQPVPPNGQVYIPWIKDLDSDQELLPSLLPGGTNEGSDSVRSEAASRISLRTCTLNDLMSIPGIGEKTAEAILKVRENKGNQFRMSDLLSVPGIKQKKYDKIKPYLMD